MRYTGCLRSNLEGAPIYGIPEQHQIIPESLDISSELTAPWDQGNQGICVSVCMTDMIRYLYLLKNEKYSKKLNYYYREREDKSVDGMTPREALEIAQRDGTISSYAFINSVDALQLAMISNGPTMICLPVFNTEKLHFWIPDSVGDRVIGYHAVTFVGYSRKDNYFLLRNSWSSDWGSGGYVKFPWKNISKIIEVWTIFN